MKKTIIISIMGFFLVLSMNFVQAANVYIEGPNERGEGPLKPGGGEFDVKIYVENMANLLEAYISLKESFTVARGDNCQKILTHKCFSSHSTHDKVFLDTSVPEPIEPELPPPWDSPCVIELPDYVCLAVVGELCKCRVPSNKFLLATITYRYDDNAQGIYPRLIAFEDEDPTGTGTYFADSDGVLMVTSYVLGQGSVTIGWPTSGDANSDCKVDINDLYFIRGRLNKDVNQGSNWQADVNQDDKINILDLILVRNHLGEKCQI